MRQVARRLAPGKQNALSFTDFRVHALGPTRRAYRLFATAAPDALASIGHDKEGVAELERARADELRASTIWAAMIGTMLAEIHMHQGRPGAARALLDLVQSLTSSMPGYYYQPEIQRVEAEWLYTAGRNVEARRTARSAAADAEHPQNRNEHAAYESARSPSVEASAGGP